ncbi:hypothetical protein [Novosphingobium sp. MMS21-SN21R]|uniref:hypothetical protein n=1 Tax=Novosphingobium sp. MMS21-SN21R TaxID=2969298 RepID=UPI00288492B5|nr:hypothetical protein [Novosphingobium sp. MMS21-SN21R]MDT0506888.1 hypothetical protein [Novosphingobium sp. MMS21-SN21R]
MPIAASAALASSISLGLNIAVLVPVCGSLLLRARWCDEAYGSPSSARGILLSIYLAILAASVVLLVVRRPDAVAALLAVQIAYKVTTPLTVGTLHNPVVASNLAIAAVHGVTVWLLLQAFG